METKYDFIVIGGGSAGYAGARTAANLGLKTLVVEGGKDVGGLCILRGCMPSKTLLESAQRAETIRRAEEFGLRGHYDGPIGAAIRDRKRRLIGDFADYRRSQLENGKFEFLRANGCFAGPKELELKLLDGSSRRVEGRTFLIATGSRIHKVDVPGMSETGYWTSDDVLDAGRIPESVCVLGGGAIALELASYYAGIGSKVTVLQRNVHILKEMDRDVTDALLFAMKHRGVQILTGTSLKKVSRVGPLKRVEFQREGRDESAETEEIIYALGRIPNLDGLNLEEAGVNLSDGLTVSETQQTNQPHIFAAGDACGPYEVVHLAIQQGEIAARNAACVLGMGKGPVEKIDYKLKLFACFTHPEVAAVGLTEDEATQRNLDFLVAKYPFDDHGKAIVRGETQGFVKLMAEAKSRRLIGGSVIGPEASELIHEIAVAMRFGATAGQLAAVPHYHPTLSEIWTYPAEELAES